MATSAPENTAGGPVSAAALEARWGRKDTVWFEERLGGTVAVLATTGARTTVSLHGAQLLSYVPEGHEEVLWLSSTARIAPGKSIRGGIPLCWPWFGPHPSDASKPAHGFVRTRPWRVTGSASHQGRARLVLTFDTQSLMPGPDKDLAAFRALAELDITLDDKLTVTLTTENRDKSDIALTQALHSYFLVGDIDAIRVLGLESRPFLDKLAARMMEGEPSPVAIAAEIDRVYVDSPDRVTIEDAALRRRIVIAKQGSLSTVLWNPWIAKSARLGDIADSAGADGYKRMLCVETANAGTDVVTLAPGTRHRILTQISVERL